MTLYRRTIRVAVADLMITRPRIRVDIERQADQTQVTGEALIFNLAPERAEQIYQRAGPITIEAGYPGTITQLFDGVVQRVMRAQDDLRHVTRIVLGDQVHGGERLGAVTTRSYDGPVLVRDIVVDIVGADMGMTVGPLDAIPADATVTNFMWAGPSSDALTVVLRRVDCNWFEDDGLIRFRALDTSQPDLFDLTVSPDTGLIRSPTPTDEGMELLMFLNGGARIGTKVNLRSERVSGVYRVVGLRHEADNWEGPFNTWLDLRDQVDRSGLVSRGT